MLHSKSDFARMQITWSQLQRYPFTRACGMDLKVVG
jgi:hypothetical protein